VGAFDEKKQKSKISCKCTFKLYYHDNEPNKINENLIYELKLIHSNHITPDYRSYKLLIYLDENLTFDHYTKHLCSKLNKSLIVSIEKKLLI
jgi:hypothetical protein